LQRHTEWWQRQGVLYSTVRSAPLGALWLPLADGTDATADIDVTPEILDLDRLAGVSLDHGPLELSGDRFCTVAPYARVPWVEAILGTPIRATIEGGSMRTQAFVRSWAEWKNRSVRRNEEWFDLLLQLTDLLVARSGGRRAVTQTLMRGPSDLAEAVLGPELMCLSIYDHPTALRRFLDEATDIFVQVLREHISRIPEVEGGYVNPFGIWTPGTVVRTQCDATAFLSAAQYREWFLPYDARICEAVEYSIIHLHSCSLHTVDVLLDVERPQAIQITIESEPSGPPFRELLPVFARILEAKPLVVSGPLSEEQVQTLLDVLPHGGLSIEARQTAW
jgi:hypothetical protein